MQSAQAIVLVVEDEVLIRMDVVDQLSALGYSIIEACDGREALEVAQQYEAIDILFTDIDMPGDIDGLTLAPGLRTGTSNVTRTGPFTITPADSGPWLLILDRRYLMGLLDQLLPAA